MFGDENFFTKYFENYFDVSLNGDDPLSENNNIVKALECIADYILMGSTPKIKSDKHQNTQTSENCHIDNYYKSNDQKIFERDFRDKELAPLLDYQKLKNTIRKLRADGVKSRVNYDRLIGEINKDMKTVKDCIKRPIVFTSCSRAIEPIHWNEIDYYNFDQMRQAILISRSSLGGELGIISEDINNMIAAAALTKRERTILKFMRQDNVSQVEAALQFGCSKSNIGNILDNITSKIIEHNYNNVKWVP